MREYGRSIRGQKIHDTKKGKKFARTNVIGALCNGTHFAIKCYKESTTGDFFTKWFNEKLLKKVKKGSTIIMDNASFHRKKELQEIISASPKKLQLPFLPPYSPDFNPIEKSWANLKSKLCDLIPLYKSVDIAIYNYLFAYLS